ncbi:MAG: protein-disulfide reductase DsbD family protein [Rhodospirillaceae bacterium]|nr:protein-disulfide reductase DsbD family protein [Rhodospirillaceae bacterium]
MRFFDILGGSLAALLVLGAGAGSAEAASSDWFETPEGAVRLVTAVEGIGTLGAIPAGIEFRLEPGWKTYWRSPGDAGYPVSVDWQGSLNLASTELAWPAPHRFTLFGLDTFGYGDTVLLPVELTPATPGEPLALRATVSYLLCEEICIPYEADLALDLPAGEATPAPEAQLIDRFQSQVPVPGTAHGIVVETATVESGTVPSITLVARSELPFVSPDLLVEGTYDWRFPAPTLIRADDNHTVTLRIDAEPLLDDAPPLETLPLVLTLVDGTRGVEVTIEPGSGTNAAPVASGASLVAMLLIAMLGGLILNLMPCVLPVLSLKLLSVVGHGGGEVRAVRKSFLATAAGIVVSFLLLAAALIAFKSAGATIGWGIQFQQPLFLVAMAALVTLFAANLAGWFELPLPAWIGNRAAGGERSGVAGAFGTGILATLLATPCSAPFVGTAVGFALARGSGEILAIFVTMGIGLALPYLLVSAMPRLATALPRPGRWMIVLRRILALVLVATAVWLLRIVAEIAGLSPAVIAGLLLLAVLVLLWLRPRLGPTLRPASTILAAVLLFAALVPALLPGSTRGGGDAAPADDALWQPFEPASIDRLVGEGRTVFVDVTAEWCITCSVNKRLVLERLPVADRLTAPEIVAMRADWTRPDDGIAQYLASFGRYGIPFNVVYGPGAPEGIALPELLDSDAVLEALDRAAGRS